MPTSHEDRQPTADERAGMQWWNQLTEAQRAAALKEAGWTPRSADAPSVADAWAHFKKVGRSLRHPGP